MRCTRVDLARWSGLWLLAAASFAGLERSTPARVALAAAAAVLSGVLLRRGARAPALALPVLLLWALSIEYALHPADASAVFSIALCGAALLALVVLVHALAWHARWGRRGGRLALAALSLNAAFLLGELAAARVWPRTPHGIRALAGSPAGWPYLPDPELVHVHAPGFRGVFTNPEYWNEAFEVNSDGFRGPEWPDPMPAGELRVLVLGDSTAVGFGVRAEEAIPARLEELLAARLQTPVRVLNAGVAAYGPRHELVLLERLLPRVLPTHVVAIFYDGNDLADCRTQLLHARASGRSSEGAPAGEAGVLLRPPAGSLFGRAWWYRYSALYRRLELSLAPFVARAGLVAPDHAYAELLRVSALAPDLGAAEELRLAIEAVRGMHARCRAAGAAFLLVRLPARVQTEPGSFAELCRRFGADPARHDRTLPGRALVEACAAAGIPALDLLPALVVEGCGPNPAYFLEGHPSRRGNRLAAERIAQRLAGEGLPE